MSDDEATGPPADAEAEIAQLRRALARSEARLAQQRAEIQHRVRNLLNVIRAISSRSLERAHSLDDLAMHQNGRISALARIEEALDATAGAGADLEHLLWDEWLVVLSSPEAWRAEAKGPSILLAQKAAERIGLAFHELTTNALKFGALSLPGGRIRVSWRIVSKYLEITWSETGVPLMNTSPKHVGFGRDLLEQALPYDLHAETRLSFAPGGLQCIIGLPVQGNVAPRSAPDLPGAEPEVSADG